VRTSLLYPCPLVTETHFSIVSRMLSSLPSQIQQEIEFIRPMVEERFAKMEEYGEDWDDSDKPVCQTIISSSISSHDYFTERYAHVAHERGQGSGEVPRRRGTAIARSQFCSNPYNVFGKW
jgi:hypothetical protein